MDTKGVQVFVLAAETLNISEAGRQLGLAPAVAGARLAKLEKELEADLFHRSTRKVTLSLDGEAFLPFAKEILAQEAAANAALGHSEDNIRGTIRFAAPSTFAQLYISPLLPHFLGQHPLIDIELRLTDKRAPLIEGGFDLALRNHVMEDSGLVGRKLADDTRVLCASPDYLSKRGRPGVPEDLADHALLSFMGAASRQLTSTTDKRTCTFPPPGTTPRAIFDDGASMRIAAEAGAGICMSSLWSIRKELETGKLVRVLPDYEVDEESAIWLVYPRSNALTNKVRVLIDYLVERLRPELMTLGEQRPST